jgi:hypothetical protein
LGFNLFESNKFDNSLAANTWYELQTSGIAPPGTEFIRASVQHIQGGHVAGSVAGGSVFFDDAYVKALSEEIARFGTINIQGNFTQTESGILDITIEGMNGPGVAGGHDKVSITGAATLGGLLRVTLPEGFAVSHGNSFDVLDFASFQGAFASYDLPALPRGLIWDTSKLKTTGVLQVAASIGDYNRDGMVDGADYVVWRNNPDNFGGDHGYDVWRGNFGAEAATELWYVRGEFNNFGFDHQLIDQGDGHFTRRMSDLTPGQGYLYNVARDNGSQSEPANNSIAFADENGNITFHFYDDTDPDDGWLPNKRRTGYEDHGQFEWELMGQMNEPDWSGGPQWYLTDLGNGLHRSGNVTLPAGTYEFKFRKRGDWNVNIGADFGNHAPNGIVALAAGTWAWELDLPGGRWRVVSGSGNGAVVDGIVPEPASNVLLLMAICFALWHRRPSADRS